MNWIEITGTILSLIYLFLSVKQNVWLWFFGFASAILYAIVFFQSKFYADMSLQFYYMAVSVYGFWNWKFGARQENSVLPVVSVKKKQIIPLLLIAIAVGMAYYFVLSRFTDSDVAVADSTTTALSIVATWMLAKKIREHWLVWIFVDAFSCLLYIYKGLYFTAGLFIVYTIMAIVGYKQWKVETRTPEVQ